MVRTCRTILDGLVEASFTSSQLTGAKMLGWEKFTDLSLLPLIEEAKERYDECATLSEEFSSDGLWGDGPPARPISYEVGDWERSGLFLKAVISECDDPQPVLASLKTKLVDQQEYLEHSKIFTSKIAAKSARAAKPAF